MHLPDINLLVLVPGGVDRTGKDRTIPALLALFRRLRPHCRLVVIAASQDRALDVYTLDGYQVVSLPKRPLRRLLKNKKLAEDVLASLKFTPDVIHSFWLGGPTLLGGLLARHYACPLLVSIGGGELAHIPDAAYGGDGRLGGRLINRIGLVMADHVTVGSNFLLDLAGRKIRPFSPVSVVPLGIDTDFWQFRPPETLIGGHLEIIHLASINRVKNPGLLLNASKILLDAGVDFHLSWVGRDALNGAVQESAGALGLNDHITFTGHREQDQVKQLMRGKRFIIQTSFYESQGIAMAEAASQGVCPLGSRVGWLADMGIGRPPGAPDAADLIVRDMLHLSNRPELVEERILGLQEWIQKNDSRKCAERFIVLYYRLMRRDR